MSTQLIRRKPKNYQAKDERLFLKAFNFRFDEPTYEKFSDGFWDCFKTKAITTKLQKASAFFRTMLGLKSIIEIDSFIWATNANSENYFHWFNDVLPSIYYLKTIDIVFPVLLNEKLASKAFVKPSLELLQIEYKTVLASNIIKFKAAFKPTLTAGEGNQHPHYFPQISELFRSHERKSFDVSAKIFIVRNNLKNRNLYPIDEVITLFIKFGFLIVDTELMSFAEQMTMFSRCTHLAAVHGAGLTNMLFMPKNSKILEFRRNDDDHNNCYFSMADTLMLNYYYLLTESMIKGVSVQEDNFKADLTSLENLLHIFSK
jgi:capsular polysaccharide biosynthesis protein